MRYRLLLCLRLPAVLFWLLALVPAAVIAVEKKPEAPQTSVITGNVLTSVFSCASCLYFEAGTGSIDYPADVEQDVHSAVSLAAMKSDLQLPLFITPVAWYRAGHDNLQGFKFALDTDYYLGNKHISYHFYSLMYSSYYSLFSEFDTLLLQFSIGLTGGISGFDGGFEFSMPGLQIDAGPSIHLGAITGLNLLLNIEFTFRVIEQLNYNSFSISVGGFY